MEPVHAAASRRSHGYLKADASSVRSYRDRLMGDAAGKALIVGVSWHSTNREIGMLKSLALGEWRPVLEVPGVHFVDLQYGDAAAERAHVEMQAGNRIFTQQASGDWRETLESVAREIATFVDDKRAASGEP